MTDENAAPDEFWAELAVSLLHPIQLQIIEALIWIDVPLSASELVQIFHRKHALSAIGYHVRRLYSLGAIRPVGARNPKRGSKEKLYRLGFQ
jgi:hypothetical protein